MPPPLERRVLRRLTVELQRAREYPGKRGFDLLLGGFALAAAAPLLALLAAAVFLQDRHAPFSHTEAVGKDGVKFRRLRFRVGHPGVERTSLLPLYRKNDPRLTRLGRWLHVSGLADLPQLANVLLGHMSLVGPAPHHPTEADYWRTRFGSYDERHRVRPGLWGPTLLAAPDASEQTRLRYDLFYTRKASLGWDGWLLLFAAWRKISPFGDGARPTAVGEAAGSGPEAHEIRRPGA